MNASKVPVWIKESLSRGLLLGLAILGAIMLFLNVNSADNLQPLTAGQTSISLTRSGS